MDTTYDSDVHVFVRKYSVDTRKFCLFDQHNVQLSEADLRRFFDEGRLFQAKQLKDTEQYMEAIKLFGQISTADASFQAALVRVEIKCNRPLFLLCSGCAGFHIGNGPYLNYALSCVYPDI